MKRRRLSIAKAAGLGATAFVLFACQGQGAFNAIQTKLAEISGTQNQILTRINELEAKIEKMPAAAAAAPGQPAAKQQPQRPPGPDPKATYKVAINGAHAKGPADAKITIVEWSDFQ